MFWSKRASQNPERAAAGAAESRRRGNRNADLNPEFLIRLEQLIIANMLWMAR